LSGLLENALRAAAALLALVWGCAATGASGAAPKALVPVPVAAFEPEAIAVVVNDDDPESVAVASYYAARRQIGADHVVHLRFARTPTMTPENFSRVRAQLEARAPASVQGYALAWTWPYRVGCMSVTSAFALGYDESWCAEGCRPTRPSPYFDSASRAPWSDLHIRPAMLVAGSGVDAAKRLIDRGVRSDFQWPQGTAYLVSTSDRKRNVRAATYAATERALGSAYPIRTVQADQLEDRADVMFYFTGTAHVAAIDRNHFLDGALGDHLTSFGGVLDGQSQTTALAWLDAGATGSYGTVVEPCAFPGKFPEIAVVMGRYLSGETLLEAYWKSVRMPGQGLFVGDPLARPFAGMRIATVGTELRLQVRLLLPGRYRVQIAGANVGPYRTVGTWTQARIAPAEISLPPGARGYVRLQRTQAMLD